MLNVSDRALDVIEGALATEEFSQDEALRLSKTGQGQIGLVRGSPQDSDQVVTRDEKPLLYVDGEVSLTLDGATLDVEEADGQSHLTLKPPA